MIKQKKIVVGRESGKEEEINKGKTIAAACYTFPARPHNTQQLDG